MAPGPESPLLLSDAKTPRGRSPRPVWLGVASVVLLCGALAATTLKSGHADLASGAALASGTSGPGPANSTETAPRRSAPVEDDDWDDDGATGVSGPSNVPFASAGVQRIDVPMSAFLQFDRVVEWLKRRGVADPKTANDTTLMYYLPVRLTIDFAPELVSGALGHEASGGYVSFNVYYGERASWLVVMNYRGELAQVAPADSVAAEGAAHFCGLKNRDEDTLLLARETNYSGSGGVYLWNWRDDRYTRLGGHGTTGDDDGATTTADVFSAHDAQWSSAHGNAFWAPEAGSAAYSSGNSSQASTGDHVLLVEADTGEVLRKFWAEGGSEGDINHAQFVENDTAAVVSLRLFDGIAKYNVTGGANGGTLRWIVGGKFGHWPIYGIEGHRGKRHKYPAGETVWRWQHNAEYMGEGEYFMFDNGGLGNESRLLIVSVDEKKEAAYLEWEYRLGCYTEVFGDADPVPSGNVLGNYWREQFSSRTPDDEAHAGVIEVDRATNEPAWHLRVYGEGCDASHAKGLDANHSASCANNIWNGWKMYSVERFYDAPLLPDGNSTMGAPVCHGGKLAFNVFNSFKESNTAPGTWTLTEQSSDKQIASGAFEFTPHWRPTEVRNVSITFTQTRFPVLVDLMITNERGRSTKTTVSCTKAGGDV